MNTRYPDRLQAFVDGQLAPADRARLLEEMERDPELREAACELRRLKEYVSCAFEDPPEAPAARSRSAWPWRGIAAGVAASLLLPTGFLLGRWSAAPAPGEFFEISQQAMQLVATPQQTRRVVLHVDDANPGKFLAVLNSAEDLVRLVPGGEVEVIANAAGLDLVRADGGPYKRRVKALMERYPNVHFVACNITLDKLRDRGEEPVLVPGTDVAPSAAERILQRMEDGWIYLRI